MKKILSFTIIAFMCGFLSAQSVDNEKIKWTWHHVPLIKLPVKPTSFRTNNQFLEVKGITLQNDADLILTGGVLPAVSIQSPDIKNMMGTVVPGYSQVYWVKVQTREGKTVYYRIFNEFGEVKKDHPIQPGEPITSDMFYYGYLSKQISLIFSEFNNSFESKLFYIKKGVGYEDLNQAYSMAVSGARMMAGDSLDQGKLQLAKAVELWSEALKQYQPDDKQAHINKKIAEVLYKNLIPGLFMLDRFDEAKSLIEKSEKEMGMFYSIFTGSQKYYMKQKQLSYMASNLDSHITLNKLDIPEKPNLITSSTHLVVPNDITTIKTLLAGSWRIVSVNTKIPERGEVDVNINDKRNKCWHLLPDSKAMIEGASSDSTHSITFEDYNWQARKSPEGKPYLLLKDGTETLPNEILYLDRNSMLVKIENLNPNVDVSYYYFQLERVGLLVNAVYTDN